MIGLVSRLKWAKVDLASSSGRFFSKTMSKIRPGIYMGVTIRPVDCTVKHTVKHNHDFKKNMAR